MTGVSRWYISGMLSLGLLTGLMVGMSLTPVVGIVLGLVFTFFGGSLVVTIKDKSTEQLNFIGKSIFSVSLAIIAGTGLGILLREYDWRMVGHQDAAPFNISQPITYDDIIELNNEDVPISVILTLLKTSVKHNNPEKLGKTQILQLLKMKDKAINPIVIRSMLDRNYLNAVSGAYFSEQEMKKFTDDKTEYKAIIEYLNKVGLSNERKKEFSGFALFNNPAD